MERRRLPRGSYSQRLLRIYRLSSIAVVCLGIGWGVTFAFMGLWTLAAVEALLAVVGVVCLILIAKGRPTVALLTMQFVFLLFAIFFSLFYDVPSESVPRVSHLFLLILAMLGYVNYQRERSLQQIALIVLGLVSFIVLSSTTWSFSFAEPIPDAFRRHNAWINVVLATAMLCGCIYVMQREFARGSRLRQQLRAALWNNEFVLHYQPQIGAGGRILGAEALIRWEHPEKGLLLPAAFLPAAEQAGLMPRIGGWVLKDACRTLAAWSRDASTRELSLAINVSAEQFLLDGFERLVLDTLQAHGVDPRRLKLELTESTVVADVADVARKMQALRGAGVVLALDDFGTGYSSLSHLRSLPFEELKIDRSFVHEAVANPRGETLAKGIVKLGHDLDLKVMAEGIETAEQHRFFLAWGCSEFQGRHFGDAIPLASFERQVEAEDRAPDDLRSMHQGASGSSRPISALERPS